MDRCGQYILFCLLSRSKPSVERDGHRPVLDRQHLPLTFRRFWGGRVPKFTDDYVTSLQVPEGKRDVLVFDDALPGFFCRKFTSGSASYGVQYDHGTRTRRITLGRVQTEPSNLKDMRKLASQTLAKVRLGTDVAAEKRTAIAPAVTFGSLVPSYLEGRKSEMKPRSYKEITRHLEKSLKKLHSEPVAGISRKQVVEALDKIAAASGPTAADRVRSSLSTFFAWAIDRHHASANPCTDIRDRASANGGRDRTLSEAELREVWLAASQDHDHDRIVRLLILTGQRREEIGGLARREVNKAACQIELPPARVKNKRAHIVPLSKAALQILDGIEEREESAYVFGRLKTAFSGWSRCKERLDTRIAAAREKAGTKEAMPAWRLHDLRRTFSTLMREKRLADPHLIELIINHVSGTRGGVAGVYDRSERLEERREALEKWGRYISKLVL
jgi:integrase